MLTLLPTYCALARVRPCPAFQHEPGSSALSLRLSCTALDDADFAFAHFMDEHLFRAHALRFDLSCTYMQYPAELTAALMQCQDPASDLQLRFVECARPGSSRMGRLTIVRCTAGESSREVMSLNFHRHEYA